LQNKMKPMFAFFLITILIFVIPSGKLTDYHSRHLQTIKTELFQLQIGNSTSKTYKLSTYQLQKQSTPTLAFF
jgi:hypothetical protein